MEDSWSLRTTAVFNLLQYVVLFEIYEENTASHRYGGGKQSGIFKAYIDTLQILQMIHSKLEVPKR